MIIRSSQVLNRIPDRTVPRTGRIVWPRYIGGQVRMVPIAPERIPSGWQSVNVRVPMRLASCEEADCPRLVTGWTEVIAGTTRDAKVGKVSADEAAAQYGYFGPSSVPPVVIHHEPGTPCPMLHKVPSEMPPVYTVNGRTVLWSEFEDSLLSGWEHASRLVG